MATTPTTATRAINRGPVTTPTYAEDAVGDADQDNVGDLDDNIEYQDVIDDEYTEEVVGEGDVEGDDDAKYSQVFGKEDGDLDLGLDDEDAEGDEYDDEDSIRFPPGLLELIEAEDAQLVEDEDDGDDIAGDEDDDGEADTPVKSDHDNGQAIQELMDNPVERDWEPENAFQDKVYRTVVFGQTIIEQMESDHVQGKPLVERPSKSF